MRGLAIEPGRIDAIELLRFIAASLVVFVHLPTLGHGHMGVDIFFTISGFVMMHSTSSRRADFFTKRLIRIVPIYYLFTLAIFVLAWVRPELLNSTAVDWAALWQSLLFIPFDKSGSGHSPILFLGWTLNYEMYFYAVFALALKLSHRRRALVSGLILVMIFAMCRRSGELPLRAYGEPIVFEFLLGMLIYLLLYTRDRAQILGLVILSLIVIILPSAQIRLVALGLPAAFIVLISLIIFGKRRLPSLFTALGGASYALYLCHPFVIQAFAKTTRLFETAPVLGSIMVILLANLLALAIHFGFERQITRALRRRLISPPLVSQPRP